MWIRTAALSLFLLGVSLVLAPTLFSAAPAPPSTTPATGPATTQPRAKHAVIISIDGCRPDVLLRANIPTIRSLMDLGSFTFYAETTLVAITIPSHTSMLTGYEPAGHGIDFNSDPPDGVFPDVPTVLELAHDRGMTTGVFSTKSKFTLYTRPGVIDYVSISKESSASNDQPTADAAAKAIRDHKPGAMLVHFGNTDRVGHDRGWGTPEQVEALNKADTAVGTVVEALRTAGIFDDTLIIISSDHGGSGTQHGANDPRSRYIPWIAVGPQIRKGYDLTRSRTRTIRTEDTFATAAYFLGIPATKGSVGRPVMEVFAPAATRGARGTRGGT